MPDDIETQDDFPSVYEQLGVPDPDEKYAAEAEEADEQLEKDTKISRKMASKMDEQLKKFNAELLTMKRDHFLESADEDEADFFKSVAGDIKTPEELDDAIRRAKENSAKLKEVREKYREEYERQAKEEVRKAYGTSGVPVGAIRETPEDEIEELRKRNAAGDMDASMRLIFGNDPVLGRILKP